MHTCLCILGAILLAVVLNGKKNLRLNKLLGGWDVVVVPLLVLAILNEISGNSVRTEGLDGGLLPKKKDGRNRDSPRPWELWLPFFV